MIKIIIWISLSSFLFISLLLLMFMSTNKAIIISLIITVTIFSLLGAFNYLITRPLSTWFHVKFTSDKIFININHPLKRKKEKSFYWSDIVKVCFEVRGMNEPDHLYIFCLGMPQSYRIPAESDGFSNFIAELVARKLLPLDFSERLSKAKEGDKLFYPS